MNIGDIGGLSGLFNGFADIDLTGLDKPKAVPTPPPSNTSMFSGGSGVGYIDSYLDALREGEGGRRGENYTDTIQEELVDQEFLPDIFITGEGEASGREADAIDAYARAPIGSLSSIDVGEFTFDKTQEDFPKFNRYGDLSDEQLKSFQEELLPVLAGEMAIQQGENRQEYIQALMTSYERNPQVREIYAKYGVLQRS